MSVTYNRREGGVIDHPRHAHGPFRHGGEAPLAGFAVPCALLLLREGERHGYALRDELEAEGLIPDVDFGNLYRALRRMEAVGLVTSRWETAGEGPGPGRRVYAITPEGERHLARAAEILRAAQRSVDRFFQRYEPSKE